MTQLCEMGDRLADLPTFDECMAATTREMLAAADAEQADEEAATPEQAEQQNKEPPAVGETTASAGARAPLPDDITPDELAQRAKQPTSLDKNKDGTLNYSKTWNKWWPKFCKENGWNAKEKAVFVDADGNPIDGTFRWLFIWLYEQDVSKFIFKPMLSGDQMLTDQLLAAHP